MARVALLIGTGDYAEGLKALPAAPKDVDAIATVLRDPEMGGFDQVQTLINEPYATITETIETWFGAHQKDDLALLYLSGHGVKDARSDLYFAACNTRKRKEELVRSTAVPASFVRDLIRDSKAKRQIIILDCCFSGAFGDLLPKNDDEIDLERLLGAEGRVVLASSSSFQYSFERREGGLSVYTHYLVEGIRTGAADTDSDGAISVQELHDYAKRKVQEESPAMTPKIIVLKDEGYRIRIAKAPLGDPRVKYRKEVEAIVQEDGDEIDEVLSRRVLKGWQRRLGLTKEAVQTIEAEILEPIRQRQEKIQEYREAFIAALQHKNPLGERERKRLHQLQQILGLLDENIKSVEEEILAQRELELLKLAEIEDLCAYLSLNGSELSLEDLEESFAEHDLSLSTDDLSSEKGIDYARLRDLLQAQDWQAADQETADQMLKAIGKDAWWEVKRDDLLNFPCPDLRTIDTLWVKYSHGKFGFSVQKQIYVECGGKLDGEYPGNKIWDKFCDRVGWRVNNDYIHYTKVTFSTSAQEGLFPLGGEVLWVWGLFGVVVGVFSLLSHPDL